MRLRSIIENDLTPTNSLASVGQQAGLPPTAPQAVGQDKPLSDTEITKNAEDMGHGQPQATDQVADALKQQQTMQRKEQLQQQRETVPQYQQLAQNLHQMTGDIINAKRDSQTNVARYDAMNQNLAGVQSAVRDLQHQANRPI